MECVAQPNTQNRLLRKELRKRSWGGEEVLLEKTHSWASAAGRKGSGQRVQEEGAEGLEMDGSQAAE